MNKFTRNSFFITCLTCCSLALFTSCGNEGGEHTSKAPAQKDTAAKAANQPNMSDMGFTLPVLDALFFEEGFEAQLKSEVQLTDEQIQKLKEVAQASVSDLTEEGDYSGSARSANKYTEEQIKSIIGEEKTDRLLQLVAKRYANGEVEGLLPTKPNSVPADTRIVVNAPAFRMDLFQNGKLLKTYRIGIGYPEFPLPTGMRRAEEIIFNPTWTPPDEPWVKGKFKPGQKVAAGSKLNPLGPIKIPIGLPSLMHGGKAVAKLGNFASHGCVGMTNEQVQDFTALLAQLSGTPLTPDSIQGFEKNKTKTKSVKLTQPVPVELRYETIVAENGGLHIYRDVYERGTNTTENVTRILDIYGVKYESLSAQEKAAITQALYEMNLDPKGQPIAANADNATAASSGAGNDSVPQSKDGVAASKVERAKKGKETKTITGQKEMVVPLASLNGKGYPTPVNLDAGEKTEVAAKR